METRGARTGMQHATHNAQHTTHNRGHTSATIERPLPAATANAVGTLRAAARNRSGGVELTPCQSSTGAAAREGLTGGHGRVTRGTTRVRFVSVGVRSASRRAAPAVARRMIRRTPTRRPAPRPPARSVHCRQRTAPRAVRCRTSRSISHASRSTGSASASTDADRGTLEPPSAITRCDSVTSALPSPVRAASVRLRATSLRAWVEWNRQQQSHERYR